MANLGSLYLFEIALFVSCQCYDTIVAIEENSLRAVAFQFLIVQVPLLAFLVQYFQSLSLT